jgi:uncharacterized protein
MPDSNVEVRSLPMSHAQLRVSRAEGKTPKIVGYAAVFNSLSENLGGFREIIAPGAFDEALKKSDVRALINHDMNLLMGRTSSGTLTLSADETGLRMDIDPPDSEMARHYIANIERGDMTGSSFSFTTEPDGDDWDEDADGRVVRTVRAVGDLYDVGPVVFPAYLDTSVAMRSLSGRVDPRAYRQRIALLRLNLPFLPKGSTHAAQR